ncbi:hypothetical protein D9Q98_009506 [Chlorella vulgaris]|uniref:Zinc-ribbon 15 domain-containing protein n=1 Tax=Chlorella vulgaris TaxID=3077 RepID=A0A9D4TFC0_CHLVU|nr:hypothetical protein D9Q98_009506 [Chlorella vulgaris]
MCIPFLFVCGEHQTTKKLGQARFCANCSTKNGAQLFETSGRFHFCYIPLCKTGGSRRFYRCVTCGAMYPA